MKITKKSIVYALETLAIATVRVGQICATAFGFMAFVGVLFHGQYVGLNQISLY